MKTDKMNAKGYIKAKATVYCDTCGEALKKQKIFYFLSETKEAAEIEIKEQVTAWHNKIKTKRRNCKVCQSIIDDIKK